MYIHTKGTIVHTLLLRVDPRRDAPDNGVGPYNGDIMCTLRVRIVIMASLLNGRHVKCVYTDTRTYAYT